MDKKKLIKKFEDAVLALRAQLTKNDGSSLSAVSSQIKSGYESLRSELVGNEKAQRMRESLNDHMDNLEKAIHKGDKKLSAGILDLLEKTVKELKEKEQKKEQEQNQEQEQEKEKDCQCDENLK